MNNFTLHTPILLMAFNRPNITQRVFDEIRKAKPKQFFMAVDGPRDNRPGEDKLCQATRDIMKQVDWDCEVYTLFPEKNSGIQGVHSGPTMAINWFFEHVEEGIIFEDDCLPDPSFFPFCQEMLAYYRTNEKIMYISGDNFQTGIKRGDASYYFSIYLNAWGWATWRRAWNLFDPELKSFPQFRDENKIAKIIKDKNTQKAILDIFSKEYYGEWKTWDYEWGYAIWSHEGLGVIPNVNLISNIGFGAQATHNFSPENKLANIPTQAMEFPLRHPSVIAPHKEADRYTFDTLFANPISLRKQIIKYAYKTTPLWIKKTAKTLLRYPGTIIKKNLYNKYSDFSIISHDIFIENLTLAESFSRVKGCVVECGVWRGGMIAAMAEILGKDCSYYLFDSFEGLPPAKEIDGYRAQAWQRDISGKDYFNNYSAKIDFAKKAMSLSEIKNYRILKGWFSDTLKEFKPDSPIAVLHLNSKLYDSTMQCLVGLYKHIANGGIIIISDYYEWVGCSKAVHDFLSRNQLPETIHQTPKGVCYILKQ